MQEASVSSTTSSPHKTTIISTENKQTEPSIKATTEPKERPEEIFDHQLSLTESRSSHHSKRRTHTCSKAGRRRSRSSNRKESRKSRYRRRHHRPRRSRSRSHYHSSSRRQHRRRRRRRYDTESSSSSSYQSSSQSRSPSRRSLYRRQTSSSSHLTDPPHSRSDNDGSENKLILQNSVQPNIEPLTQISGSELTKDTFPISNGLPKLSSSNTTLNGIVSLLLNSSGSNSTLTDLFGSAICGLVANNNNQTNPPSISSNSTRQARRLYIGSIPLGITPEAMVTFFNTELQSRGLCQSVGDPVICAQVNSERHFAFIELRSVEETTATLSLDGVNCLGSTLRIRRPRDYFPPGSNPSVHSLSHLNANAIFLTGIPSTLSEQNLCRLLSAYGALRSFNMLRDPVTAKPKGCGFFEYNTSESADLACLGLQNHPAGGGKFFAIRADFLLTAPLPTSLSSLLSTSGSNSSFNAPNPQINTPSNILCLSNMVSPKDIDTPEEYAEILEDVRTECLRHGAVVSIHLPQPKLGLHPPTNSCKIFVEFANVQQAQAASLALGGRKYNGRTVSTSFCNPAKYAAGEFG